MDRSQSKIILGENHPDTLNVLYKLGITYSEMGQLDEALILLKDCYERRCVVLGKDHVDSLSTMVNLANIYLTQR